MRIFVSLTASLVWSGNERVAVPLAGLAFGFTVCGDGLDWATDSFFGCDGTLIKAGFSCAWVSTGGAFAVSVSASSGAGIIRGFRSGALGCGAGSVLATLSEKDSEIWLRFNPYRSIKLSKTTMKTDKAFVTLSWVGFVVIDFGSASEIWSGCNSAVTSSVTLEEW